MFTKKRPKVTISDDNLDITNLINLHNYMFGAMNTKNLIGLSLVEFLEKKQSKLNNYQKDFINGVRQRLSKKGDMQQSRDMYYWRNCLSRLLEMVIKGLAYKDIDEKRRSFILNGGINRFDSKHYNIIKNLSHKHYDQIKKQVEIAILYHHQNKKTVKSLDFDSLMKLRPTDTMNQPIDIKAKRLRSVKKHDTGKRIITKNK